MYELLCGVWSVSQLTLGGRQGLPGEDQIENQITIHTHIHHILLWLSQSHHFTAIACSGGERKRENMQTLHRKFPDQKIRIEPNQDLQCYHRNWLFKMNSCKKLKFNKINVLGNQKITTSTIIIIVLYIMPLGDTSRA